MLHRLPWSTAFLVLAACNASSGGSGPPPWTGDDPPATCAVPEAPRDVSAPDHVVGDGTPGSCTAAALQAAATAGGTIVFDCGADPVTVTVASPIVFTRAAVLDGGGKVTLSGGGASRILYLDSGYDQAGPRLVVQRLTLRAGRSPAAGDDTARGGGAIYRDGGSLSVIDCVFLDNRAPASGQDVAGGAIYGFGGGETVITGSVFSGNQGSNGGAVGSLNGDLTIVNSAFEDNAATGSGGNPGDGGCGGAVYMDGGGEAATLCGVSLTGNRAGAIGGAFFRVSNDHTGTLAMDRCTVHGNTVTPSDRGNAGGLYLEGLALTVTRSTISGNQAFYNGGLWINRGQAQLANVTIAGNVATGSNGGGLWLGNAPAGVLLNCTIADNHAIGQDQNRRRHLRRRPLAQEHHRLRQHRHVGPGLQRRPRRRRRQRAVAGRRALRRRRGGGRSAALRPGRQRRSHRHAAAGGDQPGPRPGHRLPRHRPARPGAGGALHGRGGGGAVTRAFEVP
ncbi:MAG: right-handed parallel beta-helix repeat-containing protein [Anaeromyxobacter sp.]